MDAAIGELDRELALRAQRELPSGVVHLGVVVGAQREEVVEVGAPTVAPPDHMVQLAAVVPDTAAGDRTPSVQGSQRSSLRPVGKPGRVRGRNMRVRS